MFLIHPLVTLAMCGRMHLYRVLPKVEAFNFSLLGGWRLGVPLGTKGLFLSHCVGIPDMGKCCGDCYLWYVRILMGKTQTFPQHVIPVFCWLRKLTQECKKAITFTRKKIYNSTQLCGQHLFRFIHVKKFKLSMSCFCDCGCATETKQKKTWSLPISNYVPCAAASRSIISTTCNFFGRNESYCII